jgi:hypothetical protein
VYRNASRVHCEPLEIQVPVRRQNLNCRLVVVESVVEALQLLLCTCSQDEGQDLKRWGIFPWRSEFSVEGLWGCGFCTRREEFGTSPSDIIDIWDSGFRVVVTCSLPKKSASPTDSVDDMRESLLSESVASSTAPV